MAVVLLTRVSIRLLLLLTRRQHVVVINIGIYIAAVMNDPTTTTRRWRRRHVHRDCIGSTMCMQLLLLLQLMLRRWRLVLGSGVVLHKAMLKRWLLPWSCSPRMLVTLTLVRGLRRPPNPGALRWWDFASSAATSIRP
jgi:hypothetical protein